MLPGMDANLAQQIVDARRSLAADQRHARLDVHPGPDRADEFKAVASLTTRTFIYRVRCIGFAVPTGRFCILEAVLDFSGTQPRITYLRNVTRLGLPFTLDVEQKES